MAMITLRRRVCAPYRDLLREQHNVLLVHGDWTRPTHTLALVASPKFNELLRLTANRSRDLYQTNGVPTKSFTDIEELTPFALDVIVDYLESLPPAACQDEFIEEEVVRIPWNNVFEVLQAAQYLLLPPQLITDIMDKIQESRVYTSIANATLRRAQQPMDASFPTARDIADLVQLNALDYRFDGITALLGAASNNNLEMVNALLAKGADPNVVNSDGDTPLLEASKKNNLEMVNTLEFAAATLVAAAAAEQPAAEQPAAEQPAAEPQRRSARSRQPPSRFRGGGGGAYFGINFI